MLSKRRIFLYVLFLILAAIAVLLLFNNWKKVIEVIKPIFMAVVISYVLYPLVKKLEGKKIPRKYSILLIYFLLFILSVLSVIFVVPELINSTKQLANTLPDIINDYQKIFNGILSEIQSSGWSAEIKELLFKEIENGVNMASSFVSDTLENTLEGLVNTVTMIFDIILAMVITFYFIKDAHLFSRSVVSMLPKKWRNGIALTGREINSVLSNFVQGQLLLALIVGIMETIGLSLIGVKYALVLGLIGGVANIIPYFGPIIGAIPAIAVALIESPVKALWTLGLFVAVQQIENTFISPKIIEGKLGLHPVTTIIVVLIGGKFFGIPGMLFAVPVTAVLKVITMRTIKGIV